MIAAAQSTALPIPAVSSRPRTGLDVARVRRDFPALGQTVHGRPLVYLDNASTTQKPQSVIDAIVSYYAEDCANVHRAAYTLGERASARYDAARETVRRFVNARENEEIIFVRGATEAINLVASSLSRDLGPGDEIILSAIEHHSNIVPWQMVREVTGSVIEVIPINDRGEILVDALEEMLNPRTRLVAITHVSNALGSVTPIREVIEMAHSFGVPVLVDGAQAVTHMPVDVQDLGCDFYVFSGHKLYGPTGIGVLYGKKEVLEDLAPYQTGGDMIRSVTFDQTRLAPLPARLEAGTPNIAGAIGLGAAIDYVERIGFASIAEHEHSLLEHATRALSRIDGLRIIGNARDKAAVVSFVLDYAHPHDIATILDRQGVAIRAGHHCAQPVWQRFGLTSAARASFAFYNTHHEVDSLVAALGEVERLLR